ncbi:MAG: UDP-N-acetylmuramoyl-L-alanyl-D-glutamate--2,6-diaminopimelate ligase [Phycisphaeraceae bacterium]
MRLEQLIAGLNMRVVHGDAQRPIHDLTDDSRHVTPGPPGSPGCLFIARTGVETDGRHFIADAVARGAVAVLAEQPLPDPLPEHVTVLSADQVNQPLAGQLAERFFDHPSRKLRLVGVTGTNGKTTTAWIIRHLLHAAGQRCGFIGTIAEDVSGSAFRVSSSSADDQQTNGNPSAPRPENAKPETRNAELPQNTTPGAIDFSRLLARMVDHGCDAAVAEVSSHALDQGRVDALRFDAAIFTNLTGDHLDYHQTMDAYAAAKARLFRLLKSAGWAILNADDPYADAMLAGVEGSPHVLRCRRLESASPSSPADQHATATLLHATADGSRVRFDGPWGTAEVTLPLVGPHNVTNTLQALAAAHAVTPLGPSLHNALAHCPPVPGRLEKVSPFAFQVSSSSALDQSVTESSTDHRPENAKLPSVLVDYAHTHDALENVLSALRPLTVGRLIVLFGCGGDRDATKRPRMAQVAQRWADQIYITSDNPRTEDPQRIIDDILAGLPEAGRLQSHGTPGSPAPEIHVNPDRAAAIRAAIRAAGPDDTVLLAGKGHEDYQILGKTKHSFDDREHAAAALAHWLAEHHPATAPGQPGTVGGSNA